STSYSIIDLGTLGPTSASGDAPQSNAFAVNARGQVVGASALPTGAHPFLWENGAMRDLGTLGGMFASAAHINDRGQVVGASSTVSGAVHAVRWGGGQITDLGVLPGDSRAFGLYVNDGGEVAGQSYGGGYEHAFEWDHGVMRAPAAASLGDYATGINASGLVTVVSRVAYTWRRSLLTQLPTLPGGETHAGTY